MKTISKNEEIIVSLTLKNTNKRTGTEVAQPYVSEPIYSELRPMKELKAFQKIFLDAG